MRVFPCGHLVAAVLIAGGVHVSPPPIAAQSLPPTETPPGAVATAPPDVPSLYVLRQGDEIMIRVFGHSEVDETVTVRPDGRISVLLANDLEVAGLNTRQVTEALAERYSRVFQEPQVSVIVRSFAALRVYVGGEVSQPGMIPLNGELTALAAIFQAGGFKRTARTDSVVLIRNDGHDRPMVVKLNLKEVLKGRPDEKLRPYDVVYVPMTRIARANNFVDQYIRQLIPISLNAGFTYLTGDTAAIVLPH